MPDDTLSKTEAVAKEETASSGEGQPFHVSIPIFVNLCSCEGNLIVLCLVGQGAQMKKYGSGNKRICVHML